MNVVRDVFVVCHIGSEYTGEEYAVGASVMYSDEGEQVKEYYIGDYFLDDPRRIDKACFDREKKKARAITVWVNGVVRKEWEK